METANSNEMGETSSKRRAAQSVGGVRASQPMSGRSGGDAIRARRRTRGAAMAEFRALGLAPWLAEQARQVGLVRPTPVQAACIPAVLQGERRGALPHPRRAVYAPGPIPGTAIHGSRPIPGNAAHGPRPIPPSGPAALAPRSPFPPPGCRARPLTLPRCLPQAGTAWAAPRRAAGRRRPSCCPCCRCCPRIPTASSASC